MTQFDQLPTEEHKTGPEMAREQLERFVYNEGIDELAALYGKQQLPEDVVERLSVMQDIASNYWDFRKGAERQATSFDVEGELGKRGSPAWNTVFEATGKLGQVESSIPENQNPDYLLILGAANKSPEQRLLYGLQAVENFGTLVYMGSSRVVPDKEREIASSYLPESILRQEKITEYDLGRGAFETHLPEAHLVSTHEEERNGDTWAWSEYAFEHKGETKTAFVLNTPLDIHETAGASQTRRATSYDNYRFFAEQAELATSPDTRVVGVTNAIYVPGQGIPGHHVLTKDYGAHFEMVGFSAESVGVDRLPTQLLQETKSAIDAAKRLQVALDAES